MWQRIAQAGYRRRLFLRSVVVVWLAIWITIWTTLSGGIGTAAQATPEDELPEGAGKKILQASCTSCHALTEVTKFKGYYTRPQWRDVVQTMEDYGAKLQPGEAEVLADYLAEHLGRR
jgi:hypothetical protein